MNIDFAICVYFVQVGTQCVRVRVFVCASGSLVGVMLRLLLLVRWSAGFAGTGLPSSTLHCRERPADVLWQLEVSWS